MGETREKRMRNSSWKIETMKAPQEIPSRLFMGSQLRTACRQNDCSSSWKCFGGQRPLALLGPVSQVKFVSRLMTMISQCILPSVGQPFLGHHAYVGTYPLITPFMLPSVNTQCLPVLNKAVLCIEGKKIHFFER